MSIEGLKVQLTTEELAGLMDQSLAYHKEREAFYTTQAEALRNERDNRASGDPYYALDNRRAQSHDAVRRLTFLRAHLIPGETYRLSDHEATALLPPEKDDAA